MHENIGGSPPLSKPPSKFIAYVTLGLVGLTVLLAGQVLWEHYTRLPSREVLTQALKETDFTETLANLSVNQIELKCLRSSKKVEGTFHFEPLEGRAPVTVQGSTDCKDPGLMLEWYRHNESAWVSARENYTADLVRQEITALVAKAQLKPNPGNRDNPELALALQQEFSKPTTLKSVDTVLFKCGKAGAPYEALVRYSHSRRTTSVELETRCERAHQNFEVDVDENRGTAEVTFKLHQYNQVPVQQARAVYQEFVGASGSTSSF